MYKHKQRVVCIYKVPLLQHILLFSLCIIYINHVLIVLYLKLFFTPIPVARGMGLARVKISYPYSYPCKPANWQTTINEILDLYNHSPLGNVTGNPGVFQGYPHPHLWKPIPTTTGAGFGGYGSQVWENPRVESIYII